MTAKQADILHVWSRIGIHNQTYVASLCGVGLTTVKRTIKLWRSGKIRLTERVRVEKEQRCLRCDKTFRSDTYRLCAGCRNYANNCYH